MKCSELIEYLNRFDPEDTVSIVVVDPQKRLHHKNAGLHLIEEAPALLLEVTGTEPLEDNAEEAKGEPYGELSAMTSRAKHIRENGPPKNEHEMLISLTQAVLSGLVHIFVNRYKTTLYVNLIGGAGNNRICTLTLQDHLSHYRVEDYQLF